MKNLSFVGVCLIVAGVLLTGCHKKEATEQVKSNGLPKVSATQTAASASVAVVDIDTLAAKCTFCKEGQEQLQAKQTSYQNQLTQKSQALQKAVSAFQQKAQNGGFTSQQQGEAEQAKLVKQQQVLQNFQEEIEKKMSEAMKAYQDDLRKQLAEFLKEYNKDGRFKVIISRSGDNVLYTDPGVDITNDVIAGLNKRNQK